jgi:kynurenine formamidase
MAVARLHFPGISPAAAEWLVNNRKVKAIGIDTASIDYGQSKDFKTHQIFYAANIPGFENVASLDKLPTKGAYVVALPMKIKGGSGAPLRIVAWLQN